ncbi:MAG: DUF3427 domain-containing protein [Actinocrinis sp.]
MYAGDESATPAFGLYDSLITEQLAVLLASWIDNGHVVDEVEIDETGIPHVLGQFVGQAAARAMARLKRGDEQIEFANQLLSRMDDGLALSQSGRPRKLHAVLRDNTSEALTRPRTVLSEPALLTNASEDPNLKHELEAELPSADRVDLLCAFVRWSGLRLLVPALKKLRDRDARLRVITSTYMGVTERGALDYLVRELGAEVSVNYEQNATRLHAKAWLLRRDTGFDTAYVGSSNLSRAAILDGLEWNVRLSATATPRLLDKFEATFEAYWAGETFEPYDPDRDGARFDEASRRAGASGTAASLFDVPALVPHPYPHQREILEDLDVQRLMHGLHRNLVVAATGTGKTVVAAFDYRNLRERLGGSPSLLFVAHRQEILEQSLSAFRQVLADREFGELHVGQHKATLWRHVFASVQSLGVRGIEAFAPDHFDVVVIDEFHHAAAPTYRRIIDYLRPTELLGLTATPERADGVRVQDEYFDGRVASEMRLWEALEADLLCPFHYFGITDETDLTHVAWRAGHYDDAGLEAALSDNLVRDRLVFNTLRETVGNLHGMRGLGFCVSVKHARHMAEFLTENGVAAMAVTGDTPTDQRRDALRRLRDGSLNLIFTVDLFNEGLDIPDVDTLLLLRPTESSTIFLQQLGRGLRRAPDKAVLTVLDYVGQYRAEYRVEDRFHALTGLSRARLEQHVEADFPVLPPGCQIVLDRVAKERVLRSLKEHLSANVSVLEQELRRLAQVDLVTYLEETKRDIRDLYRTDRCWTSLRRRAGHLTGVPSKREKELTKRMRALIHVDDHDRADAYERLATGTLRDYTTMSPAQQTFARMLFFSLWRTGKNEENEDFADYDEAFAALRGESALCDEIAQIVRYGADRPRFVTRRLEGPLGDVPLTINARYSQDEILAAIGYVELGGRVAANFREGVAWCEAAASDVLLVTLNKNDREFSPQTMYRDYALSPDRFHWESQNRTREQSETGLRYQHHRERGSHVLLFTRERTQTDTGLPEPYVFHGTATYAGHKGEAPMAITWKLDHDMPTELYRRAAISL